MRTVGIANAKPGERDFRREAEDQQLMVKESGGTWAAHTSGIDAVVDLLLPWELRDFFVMDADEATDFVGGSDNRTVSVDTVEKKTTFAVHSLLGIDVFQAAAQRIEGIARDFGKKATKAVGEAGLDELQMKVERLRVDRDELDTRLTQNRQRRGELDGERYDTRSKLEAELKGIGALEELRKRLSENERAVTRANRQFKEATTMLSSQIESPTLLASLVIQRSRPAFATLKPLFDEGLIPLKHLSFVRGLLESGQCVCGQDLTEDGIHRRCVHDKITKSESEEQRANFLGQIHDAAKSAVSQARPDDWRVERSKLSSTVASLRTELGNLETDRADIEKKLDSVEEQRVMVLRDALAALDEQLSKLAIAVSEDETRRPPLTAEIDSLDKQIQQRLKGNRAAATDRLSESISLAVAQVLQEAYATIQTDQVNELSLRMDRLFAQMVANVRDDPDEEPDSESDKASARNISEVGIRPKPNQPEVFEIYALNIRRRTMNPTEVNGASRRALALSFMLSLCAESGTFAPLVADSLLNMMSGTVRRNTLRETARNSSQPILLLTPADLSSPDELEIVQTQAGATYTLTAQQDVRADNAGEVLNRTIERQISVLCSCGPRQYCSVCERIGQAGSPGWAPRNGEAI